MKHATALRPITFIALCAALALPGCKKDDATADGDAAASKEGGKAGDADDGGDADGKGEAGALGKQVAATVADSMVPADALQRGEVLGHILIPNPLGFVDEIKNNAAPAMAAMFLQEATIRSAAAAQLGPRAPVAEHIALDKPFGCVLVDSTVTDVPVACVMGYVGGAKALVADLGEQGKQADAGDHVAHYQIEGQDVFLDEMGDMVAISNHADVLAKAKPYIEENLLGRAGEIINDIEAVAFVGAGMKRYEKELTPFLESMGEMPLPADGNPFVTAMSAYSKKASTMSVKRYHDTEQATIGFSLEKAGFVMRWAWFATPGSDYEKELAAFAGGPLDIDFVGKLPAASWAAGAYRFDDKVEEVEMLTELREIFVDAYAEAAKKDATAVNAGIEKFYKESIDLYGPDFAMAAAHLPGSYGAVVVEIPLESGKSGRERWKSLASVLTPEQVLPPEAVDEVTWSFTPDAAKLGEVPVDRFVLEPGPKGKKDLASAGPEVQAWDKKLGGMRLTVDRVEVDGRAIFVLAPGDATPYTQASIDAVGGKDTLSEEAGFKAIVDRIGGRGVSTFGGFDIQRGAQWVKSLLPPEDAAKIPPKVGENLSDISMVASYSNKGSAMTGEVVVSQGFIDALRALAK